MEQGQLNWITSYIWGIADDVLRDVFVRGKYRDVILPMTVLRRLDAVLEDTKQEVLNMKTVLEEEGVVEHDPALRMAAGQAFYNTSKFTLRDLRSRANRQQLKADFEAYLDGFSPNVQDILDNFEFRNQIPRLSKADVLGTLIEKLTSPDINLSPEPIKNGDGSVKHPGLDNHGMGSIFEELVRKFNEENNEEAGEHWTPRDAVKLMANLIFLPITDDIESGTYLLYDGACGTGGMLTVAEETLKRLAADHGKEVATHLYGQEINSETYAICKADLLLKGEGEAADNIVGGPEHSTLANDAFPSREFDFMLSNPPYGKSWKSDLERMGGKKDMRDPRFVIEHAGDPEYSLVTRSSDGQMLFLANKLSKMKQGTKLGSRIAEVHNGSSLFTGDAGQGESNIRRWIIENDWLEAIVALPLNLFYNTGIATYVWVLTNRKPERRRGRVQLIDATGWFQPLRKNLGKKNCELGDDDIALICNTFLDFEETEQSKIFDNEAFGYWKVTVDRPLRVEGADPNRVYKASEIKELKAEVRSEDAPPIIKKIHKKGTEADPLRGLFATTIDGKSAVVEYEVDTDLRDTEQIPLQEEGGIEAFLRREVLPYASDAWYQPDGVKIGYEISFTRHFYKPQPMRTLEEIRSDILALEQETEGLLGEIIGEGREVKASEVQFLHFLRKSPQFMIPIYQRTYSWTVAECQRLWDDILRTGYDDRISTHFVGSIVYIEEGLSQVSSQSPLLVIDGQQRLTTVSLILEALARRLPEGTEPVDGFSAKKLRSYYLLNPLEDGERAYKLLLTQTDKQTLLSLIEQKHTPAEQSIRLHDNFEFFEEQITGLKGNLEPLCKGLAKLMVVDIALSRDQDNPQLIFESMNSTGRELTQADLIRNFILMGLDPTHQSRLYKDHWRPMEVAFGQEAYGQHFDGFMRHYLTVRTAEIPRIREVYEAFKAYARSPKVADDGVDALVKDIHTFAGHYCSMALGKEPDPRLATAFADLRELKVDVAYPLLLELYHDYEVGKLSHGELFQAVRWIESYVFRRAVCAIPTNSLNKTFANFGNALDKERYLESLQAHFLLLPSYRRFPGDQEFRRALKQRDLYNFRSRSYWLRRLENHGRKERVPVDEYTIEHIMPQNLDLPAEWREALGNDWGRVHETWLHTLGNLTLTGYNSEYSDHSFPKKRDMKGGFRESPLRLNEGLSQLDTWDEAEIQSRAERLARQAAAVWGAPSLPGEVLEAYRPAKTARVAGYSIEDHKHLVGFGTSRQLFDALRKEVLTLDPCVTEEFLKLYVAYKAETNFVDIVPQAKRLRLSINLDFHELQDPRKIAKDVTNLGRWGNGNVEVALESEDDIPYVMGLARQAFEKQMGNGEIDA